MASHAEVGFKLGKWHDVGYWRLGLCQATPPLEPILSPSLRSYHSNALDVRWGHKAVAER